MESGGYNHGGTRTSLSDFSESESDTHQKRLGSLCDHSPTQEKLPVGMCDRSLSVSDELKIINDMKEKKTKYYSSEKPQTCTCRPSSKFRSLPRDLTNHNRISDRRETTEFYCENRHNNYNQTVPNRIEGRNEGYALSRAPDNNNTCDRSLAESEEIKITNDTRGKKSRSKYYSSEKTQICTCSTSFRFLSLSQDSISNNKMADGQTVPKRIDDGRLERSASIRNTGADGRKTPRKCSECSYNTVDQTIPKEIDVRDSNRCKQKPYKSPGRGRTLFISLADDPDHHHDDILNFCNKLHKKGFNIEIDIPKQVIRKGLMNVNQWRDDTYRCAYKILICISPRYFEYVTDKNHHEDETPFNYPKMSVRYIIDLVRSEFINNGSEHKRAMPLLLRDSGAVFPDHIPEFLRSAYVSTDNWNEIITRIVAG